MKKSSSCREFLTLLVPFYLEFEFASMGHKQSKRSSKYIFYESPRESRRSLPLPNDIILYIMSFLDGEDLGLIFRSCLFYRKYSASL